MQPVINWESLPDFTLGDSNSSTLMPNANEGWDNRATRISAERRRVALSRANGILSGLDPPAGSGRRARCRVRFFVTDFKSTIGVSGRHGQGRRVRDFYPNSLTMPMFQITGQTLDQNDYGLLCEFIHASHQNAISNGRRVQFNLLAGGLTTVHGKIPRTMKGPHKPITVEGYVESIRRTHKRFGFAPTFTFDFAIVQSYEGTFEGMTFYDDSQRGFVEVLTEVLKETPFSQAPKTPKPKRK